MQPGRSARMSVQLSHTSRRQESHDLSSAAQESVDRCGRLTKNMTFAKSRPSHGYSVR